MSIITTVKDKILTNSILARILASGKDSRTKVVLARKIEKQGLGSTPVLTLTIQIFLSLNVIFKMKTYWKRKKGKAGAELD